MPYTNSLAFKRRISMKYFKFTLLMILSLPWLVYSANNPAIIDENILFKGTWNCSYEIKKDGMELSIITEDNYVRNGRSNSFGTLMIKLAPDIPKMEYFIAGSALWEIKNKYLITTLQDISIKNLSHPEFDEEFNLENMIPKNISESSEIIELSNSKLSLKSEADGVIYSCTRNNK
jgi:hypothetical protein